MNDTIWKIQNLGYHLNNAGFTQQSHEALSY